MSSRGLRRGAAGEAVPPAAWVVRGGREGERVEDNIRESVVTLGWGDWIVGIGPVEHADGDDLDAIFERHYEKKYPESLRRRCRQEILRFRDGIHVGDLVVLPFKDSRPPDALAAIGEVAGPAVFDPRAPVGTRIRRRVRWLMTELPKNAVEADLLSSIRRTQLTVFQPRAADSAWRIYRIATHGADPLAACAREP